MPLRTVRLVLVLTMALLAGGCVMKGTYLQKVEEADTLGKDLTTLEQRYRDLQTENSALKARIDELQAQISGLTTDKERLTLESKELSDSLKASRSEALQSISELRQRIADLEEENRKLQDDLAGLRKASEAKVREVSRTYESLLETLKNEIALGQVSISEMKGRLTVNLVESTLFASGKAEIKAEGTVVLQKLIDILKEMKNKTIMIEGHTDNVPISEALAEKFPSNWELAAARAINVARFLQQQGVDPTQLAAVSYGEYRPVESNDSQEGRARNRRIEITLVSRE